MPLYEYRCTTCAHRFEELVYGERHPPCPSCGAAVEQLFSAFAVGRGGETAPVVSACGTCGDPRGPGACRN